jgi:hypothetical protein
MNASGSYLISTNALVTILFAVNESISHPIHHFLKSLTTTPPTTIKIVSHLGRIRHLILIQTIQLPNLTHIFHVLDNLQRRLLPLLIAPSISLNQFLSSEMFFAREIVLDPRVEVVAPVVQGMCDLCVGFAC